MKVGQHIRPDPATVPGFMASWCLVYERSAAGENALIALIAAHLRLRPTYKSYADYTFHLLTKFCFTPKFRSLCIRLAV